MAVYSAHLCRSNVYPLRPRRATWIDTEREGMRSGRYCTLKPGKLDLSCKANKYSDVQTADYGVLPRVNATIITSRW